MSNIGDDIVKNKYIIIAILLLIFLLILFFVHLYFNIRAAYFPHQKENKEKETLFYKRLKYILFFIVFLISLIILYLVNPNDIIANYFGSIILISIILGTFLITMISWYNYAYKKEPNIINTVLNNNDSNKTPPPVNYFYRSILFLLIGGGFAGILYLLVFLIDPMSTPNSIVSLIVNIVIILIILALVYKIFNVNNNSTIFSLVVRFFNFLKNILLNLFKFTANEYHSTTFSSIIVLLITIFIIYVYFKIPNFKEIINLQGGKQLINKPINTNNLNVVASYEELNGTDNFEYQYAISFWLFVNSYPPNTNFSSGTYVSILNYGNKPNVLFNVKNNSLMITMQQNNIVDASNNTFDTDTNGNRIIYVKNNFLLQKWNNIIINYSGGTLDIFINGELVKSTMGIIPYMKLDNLTVGEVDGIGGGLCNLVYFNKSLNSKNIYYIYNTVKNKAPPIVDDNKENILFNK